MSSPSASTKPISPGRLWYTRNHSSKLADLPVAEAAIARDLEDEPDHDPENAIDGEHTSGESGSDDSTIRPQRSGESVDVSMIGSYRRPSFTAAGSRATVITGSPGSSRSPTRTERHEARNEERSLLRDNNIIPPKQAQKQKGSTSLVHRIGQRFSTSIPGGDRKVVPADEEAVDGQQERPEVSVSDSTPLLGDPEVPYDGQDTPENLNRRWEEAIMAGKIQTTWRREFKVIARYSSPLVVTFLLQYSLTVASIFSVGHLGKVELGAVSLAAMTANITGYAIYQGLATSLDTLCPQAYGSGRKKLVGLQMQRMVCPSSKFLNLRSYKNITYKNITF